MKTNNLINRNIKTLLATPIALGLVILATGCAGNHYDRSAGQSMDDRAVTSRVEDALEHDSIYKFSDVQVSTFKGKVQLSGFVTSKEQKSRAEEVAKNVNGVQEVVNNITLKP